MWDWDRRGNGHGHGVVYSKLHPFCCINVFRFRSLSFLFPPYFFCFAVFLSLWWLFVTLLLLFLGQLFFFSSLVAIAVGVGVSKNLNFQFVAEFSVIFLLLQFGARSVFSLPLSFFPFYVCFLLYFFSCLLCVLVCLVLLLSHLCNAINFTWPPTRELVTHQ